MTGLRHRFYKQIVLTESGKRSESPVAACGAIKVMITKQCRLQWMRDKTVNDKLRVWVNKYDSSNDCNVMIILCLIHQEDHLCRETVHIQSNPINDARRGNIFVVVYKIQLIRVISLQCGLAIFGLTFQPNHCFTLY